MTWRAFLCMVVGHRWRRWTDDDRGEIEHCARCYVMREGPP